jgi:hypothetical protein
MSVIMGLRFSVDPAKFQEIANGDRDRLLEIKDRSKAHGAIHHRFYANVAGGEVLVVDEWPDPESFQKFFEEMTPRIGQMMEEAGVTSEPRPEFWTELDTVDKF